MIGSTVGEYQIVRLIGQGGMGAVYEALQQKIGRRVALKVLLPEFATNPELIERFFNEARAVNAVNHPGIVQVSDLGTSATGAAYLVMEYLEGETLGQRLHRMAMKLPEEEAVRTGWQIAGTLAAAHAKGIVHRDIKPANVMIVPDPAGPGGERVKVLDFGIAKLASSAVLTRAGQIMGTVNHMSPEQIRTSAQLDGQSDVYSLGTVLYYLLAGRPPFFAENNDLLVLTMHLTYPPEPIERLVPELSPQLCKLIMRMLQKAPTDRPKMAEVAEALQTLDPAGSSQGLRRPSRASLAALKVYPLPPLPNQPQTLASMFLESLPNSTLAGSTGQRVNQPAMWRRALPALAVMLLIGAFFSTVMILRSGPAARRGEAPRAGRAAPPVPAAPPVAPTPESAEKPEMTPVEKSPRSAKSKASADAKMQSPPKPRKKNAPAQGKTTPVIR